VIPEELRYSPQHEWVRELGDGIVRVGITHYAQEQLGDVVFVDLPEVGREAASGTPVGEVESTKSVSEIFAPVAGEVVAVNPELEDNPALVNSDPYGAGWMLELRLADDAASQAAELLDATAYRELTDAS
jgi:glycine cleavage system H protein